MLKKGKEMKIGIIGAMDLEIEKLTKEEMKSEKTVTKAEARAAIDGLRAEAADLPEMTLDEINAEIQAARMERKSGK